MQFIVSIILIYTAFAARKRRNRRENELKSEIIKLIQELEITNKKLSNIKFIN